MAQPRSNRLTTHAMRDVYQRKVARDKYRSLRKLLPKEIRAREVRKEREAVRKSQLFAQFEEQGMGTTAAVAGGLFMGGALTATVIKVANKIGNVLDDIGSDCNKILREVRKYFRLVVDAARKATGQLWVIPLAVIGYWLLNNYAGNQVACVILLSALASLYGKALWSRIATYFSSKEVEPQSGLGSNFSSLISAVMCFTYLPKDGHKLIPTIIQRVSSVPRLKAGVEGLLEVAVKVAESVINLIHRIAGSKDADGNTKEVFFGDEAARTVKQWVSTSYKHMEILAGKPNPTMVKEVYAHVRQGYAILQVLKDQDLTNILKRAIDSLELKVAPFMGVVTAGNNFRPEPHFVLFSGNSGVGKSSILVKFAISVLLKAGVCTPKDVLSNLWQKGTSEYWNGYVNQTCVVMDDVFQKVTAKGAPDNEYMDIIRMISNWSFPLNMADLNSKGKFYFDSPLVLGTTNAANVFDTTFAQAVQTPAAVVRRVHDVIHIRAAAEYRREDNTMDYEKVEYTFRQRLGALISDGVEPTADQVVDAIPWEAWEADRANFVDYTFPAADAPFSNGLSIRELVEGVSLRLKAKLASHKASLESLETFAELLGKAKMETQSGIPPNPNFYAGFAEMIATFEPEVGAAKMRAMIKHYKKKVPDMLKVYDPFPFNSICGNPLVAIYRSFMLMLIEVFTPSEQGEITPSSVAVEGLGRLVEKWNRMYAADGEFGSFFVSETISLGELRVRMQFLGRVLTDYDLAIELGLNSDSLTALWSWFRSAHGRMVEFRETERDFNAYIKAHLNLVSMCKAFILGMWKSLCELDAFAMANKLCVAVLAVVLLRKLAKLVLHIVMSVVGAVQAALGLSKGRDKEAKDSKPTPEDKFEPEGNVAGVLQSEAVYDKIYRNVLVVYIPRINCTLGQLLFVSGTVCVAPKHFDSQIEDMMSEGKLNDDDIVEFYAPGQRERYVAIKIFDWFRTPRFHPDQRGDSVFMKFSTDTGIHARKDIRGHFVHSRHHAAVEKAVTPTRLDFVRIAASGGQVFQTRVQIASATLKRAHNLPIGKNTPEFLWITNCSTRVGDCGAPLMIARQSLFADGRCLLGIHVGGNTCPIDPRACAMPVSAEDVDAAMAHFKPIVDKFDEDLADRGISLRDMTFEEESGLRSCGLVGGSFTVLGTVDKPVSVSPVTKLKATPIRTLGVFGPSPNAPAKLSSCLVNGEYRHPMVEGLRNYQSLLIYKRIPDLEHIVGVATQRFMAVSALDTRDIFTFREAVESPLLLKIKPLNRSTSAGYPYVLEGSIGKRKWLGDALEIDYNSEQAVALQNRCEYIIQQAASGVRLSHICIDFLKDELRPLEKVSACATRIISASPLDYVICVRMYFGAFMAAMFRNHTRSGFTPGINPYQEWWQLAHEMLEKGDKCFDGDFKRFDASQMPYILWALLRFINQWYGDGDENARIREVLFMDIVHSRHLTGIGGPMSVIVQWCKSIPSGNALTTPLNSLYSMVCLVLCYARVVGDPSNFWEKCYAATNGDDNIVSVVDEVADRFNQVTVAEAMLQHLDMVYTSGAKDGTLIPHKPLEELVFLKRGFLRDPQNEYAKGGWLAPLDFASFLYGPYYTKAKKEVYEDIATKLEFALCELCLHTEDKWDVWIPKFRIAYTYLEKAPKLGYNRLAYQQFVSRLTDFWY